MSKWTHVVGNIRVDGIPFGAGSDNVKRLDSVISSKLPTGSEGPLQYEIIEYADGLPWVTIPIWGDLRDFSSKDVELIKIWWWEVLSNLGIIRDAVILIETEGAFPVILTDDPNRIYE